MTPENITDEMVSNLDIKSSSTVIEPSFGTGNFIKSFIKNKISKSKIYGCELDEELYHDHNIPNLINKNFYEYDITRNEHLHFIGNVPFRTPALSLQTHKHILNMLNKKYNVSGIREEAVFFILYSIYLIEKNNNGGRISYIIPKSILTNNSKFYKTFHNVLEEKFKLISIKDLPKNIFDGAALETCILDLEYDTKTKSSFLKQTTEYWNFNEIFKRTYLGSVPCESIFVSAPEESKEEFQLRLIKLFNNYPNEILTNSKHNGLAYLSVLNSKNTELVGRKILVIQSYIRDIFEKIPNFIEDLKDINMYNPIHHRKTIRFYYRNKKLKKCDFVYEINPNPCKSFYFTGNPSSTSTDYFGYCDFDITRNSSPGACRTIPIDMLQNNITSEFKVWWDKEVNKPIEYIFDLFIKTHKSKWYSEMKQKYKRFYFGIPKDLKKLDLIK